MKKIFVTLLISLVCLTAGSLEAQDSREASLLGNPGERMNRINQLLREAGEKIMEQKKLLDDVAAKIVSNDRKMASPSATHDERQNLKAQNIAAFYEIETIRERIATIQFETAREVFRIEQDAYQIMKNDVSQKNIRIQSDPLGYWLSVRKLLMTPSELASNISDDDLKKIYR